MQIPFHKKKNTYINLFAIKRRRGVFSLHGIIAAFLGLSFSTLLQLDTLAYFGCIALIMIIYHKIVTLPYFENRLIAASLIRGRILSTTSKKWEILRYFAQGLETSSAKQFSIPPHHKAIPYYER